MLILGWPGPVHFGRPGLAWASLARTLFCRGVTVCAKTHSCPLLQVFSGSKAYLQGRFFCGLTSFSGSFGTLKLMWDGTPLRRIIFTGKVLSLLNSGDRPEVLFSLSPVICGNSSRSISSHCESTFFHS